MASISKAGFAPYERCLFRRITYLLIHPTRAVNRLKGKITILFITHLLPKGVIVDETVKLGVQLALNDITKVAP